MLDKFIDLFSLILTRMIAISLLVVLISLKPVSTVRRKFLLHLVRSQNDQQLFSFLKRYIQNYK